MIKIQVTNTLNVGAYKSFLTNGLKQAYADSMTYIVADIVLGINSNKAIQGGSLPALEPETIKRKGHGRPLIEKGLLSQEYTYQKLNQYRSGYGEITIKDRSKGGDTSRKKVGNYLQLQGINSKRGKKYFYFFGISKDSEKEVLSVFDDYILKAMQQL